MMKYLDLLGHQVTDRVTGFGGVVESVTYDLYGCIQAFVKPRFVSPGEWKEGHWFDVKRLTKNSTDPVMPAPSFEEEDGPAELPPRKKRAMPGLHREVGRAARSGPPSVLWHVSEAQQ